MKLNTKIKVLEILGLLAGSSLSSGAQVLLTLEEIDTGGVSVTASGSINTSAFTFLDDLENDDGGNVFGFLSVDSFLINRSGDEEIFLAQGSEFNTFDTPFDFFFYDDFDIGSFGNAFQLIDTFDDNQFSLIGFNASRDRSAPALSTFNFDFVLTDNDGDIDDYSDGLVIWDSNGFDTEGGETITFSVVNVPEPSSSALLGLGAIGLLVRRKRST